MSKKGQVAVFVIVAIVIVALIAVIFLFPGSRSILPSNTPQDPASYIRQCIEPTMKEKLDIITKQGGSNSPDNYVLYQDNKIQYLCYNSENYKPCVVQQPLLVSYVQSQLTADIRPIAQDCMNNLKKEYEGRGYQVSGGEGDINVTIIPGSINLAYSSPLTITKDNTQTFRPLSVRSPSEVYDLLTTATSIVQFESTLGDSETTLYLQYYPDLKIEKLKRDSDTIYTITNVVSDEKFTFATRSLVWPSGYGGSAT